MISILATDNKLRKKEWAIEFEGPASFFACRHYIHTHTHACMHACIHTYIQRSREWDKMQARRDVPLIFRKKKSLCAVFARVRLFLL